MTTTTNPRIYAACLASYNAGRLHGLWIDATTDVDAMQAEINAMLAASPEPNVTRANYHCDACGAGHTYTRGAGEGFPESMECPACDHMEKLQGKPFPSAEEWAIHDSEGLGDIGEYAGLEEVARRVAIVEAADDAGIPAAVLIEAMNDAGAEDPEDFISDQYDGTAETWKDFVQERADDCFDMSAVPAWLEGHIDWDSLARDWEISGDWSAYRDGEFGELYFFRTT